MYNLYMMVDDTLLWKSTDTFGVRLFDLFLCNFTVSVFELNNFKQICLPRTLFFVEQTMKKHLTSGWNDEYLQPHKLLGINFSSIISNYYPSPHFNPGIPRLRKSSWKNSILSWYSRTEHFLFYVTAEWEGQRTSKICPSNCQKRHKTCRERKKKCYFVEIIVLLGILEILLSNGS